MKNEVLAVEGLGKKYKIHQKERSAYSTFVESFSTQVNHYWSALKQARWPTPIDSYTDFWALEEVSFKLKKGERLGVIGRNGSGKSTLLKLISKVTAPSRGEAIVKGRIASLLEVGTGFHPELTGRENIFLCGAIMGMKRWEIVKKFDEIVAFSGIGKFLDTPVKRYSSGMYTRLGFSIGAHLRPDLLVLDEVLAVGDLEFQQKCLEKLAELAKGGTAIIFVSHDLGAVLNFCDRGLLLERGCVKGLGPVEEVVNGYMQELDSSATSWKGDFGDEYIRFNYFTIKPPPEGRKYFIAGEKIHVQIDYEVLKENSNLILGVKLRDLCNRLLARSYACDIGDTFQEFNTKGEHSLTFTFDSSLLYENEYFLNLECVIHNLHPVVNGEIVLKFWVSHPNKVEHFAHAVHKPGVCLGYDWQEVRSI